MYIQFIQYLLCMWTNCVLVSKFVFSHLVYCCMSSLLVDLLKRLLDPTTSDLRPAITLATTALVPCPGTAYLKPRADTTTRREPRQAMPRNTKSD